MDTLESSRAAVRQRVARLRDALERRGFAAVLIPSSDPHLSEYLPERWASRVWASGFTGSAGTLVVARDFASVWVDSRYWMQADAELAGTGVESMRIPGAASTAHVDWLAEHLSAGDVVAVDGSVIGVAAARQLRAALAERGISLETGVDLLDDVWPDRPSLPTPPIYEHASPFAPRSRADKLADVRAAMKSAGADVHFVSTLDDIAWLFNLRGNDVDYNPVFVAHALVEPDSATLFIGDGKVPAAVRAALDADGVRIGAYDDARKSLATLADDRVLLLDPRRITLAFREAVPSGVRVVEAINPSTFAKSRKSADEAAHVRRAMEQDGAALAEFFAWARGCAGARRAHHRNSRSTRRSPRPARSAKASSRAASRPSPASTATARCRTTARPSRRTRSSKATVCC